MALQNRTHQHERYGRFCCILRNQEEAVVNMLVAHACHEPGSVIALTQPDPNPLSSERGKGERQKLKTGSGTWPLSASVRVESGRMLVLSASKSRCSVIGRAVSFPLGRTDPRNIRARDDDLQPQLRRSVIASLGGSVPQMWFILHEVAGGGHLVQRPCQVPQLQYYSGRSVG